MFQLNVFTYTNSQADAVAESMASKLDVAKRDILDLEAGNMAVRLALAETHVIQETIDYLKEVRPWGTIVWSMFIVSIHIYIRRAYSLTLSKNVIANVATL